MDVQILNLGDGETAIVGYGSLLSADSIGNTLKRQYGGPFIRCHIEGWRRSWNVSMPNEAYYFVEQGQRIYPRRILYLNACPLAGALMNCVMFVVRGDELEAMHQREWIYEPTEVTGSVRGVRLDGGKAMMYVAKQEHLVRDTPTSRDAAIRASYLRILEQGLRSAAPAFQAEYEKTTDLAPEHLIVDDILDPDRPTPRASAGRDYRPS